MYGHITRVKLKDQVVERLLQIVDTNGLKPGDLLPTERELGANLGVSRTVIREALHQLEARGLIRIEHGRGAVIDTVNGRAFRDTIGLFFRFEPDSLWDLLEVRKPLEIEIAGLAAWRANEEDLREMRAALEKMREDLDSPEGYVDADVEFHSLLARSARNKVLPMMIEPITDLLLESRRIIGSRLMNARRALQAHEAILERVEKEDPEGAREEMRKHLMATEQDFKTALEAPIEERA
ncbi:MAG: FadR/GntR family transcriptional regulator [Rubrobacteraceae bacterium]